MLATDGALSYVLFLYGDGEIQWTTGDNSGGDRGLGGTPALVGVNAGDGTRSSSVPESRTAAIINIASTSNVEQPGLWVFQVNNVVEEPSTLLLCL